MASRERRNAGSSRIANACNALRSFDRPSTSWLNPSGQGQYLLADRVPFRFVAVEQPRRRPAVHGGGQLPAQVHRVLDAGVHALPAERRVHVGRVAGQEHAPDPVRPACRRSLRNRELHRGSLMPKSSPAMRRNASRISAADSGSASGTCSRAGPRRCPEPAVAERHHDDRAVAAGPGEHRLLGRVGQLHVGEHDVGLVLRADEVDPTRRRTALCAPSQPTTYAGRCGRRRRPRSRRRRPGWMPGPRRPYAISTPSSAGALSSTRSVPLCGAIRIIG
jgi:hypothetical protein